MEGRNGGRGERQDKSMKGKMKHKRREIKTGGRKGKRNLCSVSVPCWDRYLSVLERCKLLAGMKSSLFRQGVDLCSPTVLTTR